MLQRVQSVLLLLTALALGVFLGTNSFVKAISPSEKVVVNPYHVYHQIQKFLLRSVGSVNVYFCWINDGV